MSIIRGHNRKKSTFRFFVLVEEYQRRMERDEKDLRDTKQAHLECEQEASLVVCLNYKIIRERHKKNSISVGEVMIIMMNHKNRHPMKSVMHCV